MQFKKPGRKFENLEKIRNNPLFHVLTYLLFLNSNLILTGNNKQLSGNKNRIETQHTHDTRKNLASFKSIQIWPTQAGFNLLLDI